MRKKATSIPVNTMSEGIVIGKASIKGLRSFEEFEVSHRDNYHVFFILEKGSASVEIDFKKYTIKSYAIAYIHPNQVHRMTSFKNVTAAFCLINNENLNAEYLSILAAISPAKPLPLNKGMFPIISESIELCIKLSERKSEKLYFSLLKNSCNTLVGLIASQYLQQVKPADKLSRFEVISKAFRAILEDNFIVVKRPAEYAQKLNLSVSYLNEAVKNTTGYPVSYHIQQRIILEAKRLLCYSDKPVKEIASEVGYDDYPYFSRLFTKVAGMSALLFRNKNRV